MPPIVDVTDRTIDASMDSLTLAQPTSRGNMLEALAAQAVMCTPLPVELWLRIFREATSWPPSFESAARAVWPHIGQFAAPVDSQQKRWQRFQRLQESQRERAITGYVRGFLAKTRARRAAAEQSSHSGGGGGGLLTVELLADLQVWEVNEDDEDNTDAHAQQQQQHRADSGSDDDNDDHTTQQQEHHPFHHHLLMHAFDDGLRAEALALDRAWHTAEERKSEDIMPLQGAGGHDSDLEERAIALVCGACEWAARRAAARPPPASSASPSARGGGGGGGSYSLQLVAWPSKRIAQLAATLLICLRLDERLLCAVPATTRPDGDVVSNEELDLAIRSVVRGQPDCPAIRRFLQGLRLLGGVLMPAARASSPASSAHAMAFAGVGALRPALRLDLRPLRRLHTQLMLPGWVSLNGGPLRRQAPYPAIDAHFRSPVLE